MQHPLHQLHASNPTRHLTFYVLFILFLNPVVLKSQGVPVPLDAVRQIADRNADALWGEVFPAEPIPYYGPDEEIIAYHFTYALNNEFPDEQTLINSCAAAFQQDDRALGWGIDEYANMVVGARSDMPVIIEYSKCLSKQYARGYLLQETAEKLYGSNYEFGKTYYLGVVNVWFCIQQGDVKKYVNLEPRVEVKDEAEFDEFMSSKQYFWEGESFGDEWSNYLKNKSPLESGNVYIPGYEQMPFLEWSYGCTPTSGAMLLGWWDQYHNYGNLIDYHMTHYDPVQEDYDHHVPWTQKDLAEAMGTNASGGTDRGDICDGYIEVIEDRGYECSSDGHWAFWWTTSELFDDIKDEVNGQRPLHVSIEGHSIIGIGYNNDTKMYMSHDPNWSTIRTLHKSTLEGTYYVHIWDNYGTHVDLLTPHGGTNWGGYGTDYETVNSNDFMEIEWISDFAPGTYVKLYYHDEGGLTLDRWFPITESTPNDGIYHWHVPDIDCYYGNYTNYARVKIEVYNQDDLLIASDGSFGNFRIHDDGGLPELNGIEIVPENPDFFSIPLAEEWWTVCGVRDAGYNAYWSMELYDDIEFQTVIEQSNTFYMANYIVLNGHEAPLQEYGVKFKNYSGATTAYAEYDDSEEYLVANSTNSFSWSSGAIVRAWDIHLEPGTYYFTLDATGTFLDLDMAIYKKGGDNLFSRQDYAAGSFNIGSEVAESFAFSPISEDDYGLVVSSGALYAGNYTITIEDLVRWTGASSDNWDNPANWSSGLVPVFTDNVLIPAGCPNDPSIWANDVFVNNLTIESGASLEIYDEYMAVYGDLTIFGELIMSTASAELMAENSITWEDGSSASILNDGAIINVYRSWYFKEGADVTLTNGTVKFVSSYPSFIMCNDDYCYFNDIEIDKSGEFQFHQLSAENLYIMGDLDINSGSDFTSSSEKAIVLNGNISSSGNIMMDAGTLKLVGTGILIDLNTGDYLHNLDISTDNACLLYSDLQLGGDFILNSGGFLTLADLYVKGNWKNFGSPALFGENENKVVFNGSGQSLIYGEEFYDFEINGTGDVVFQSGITTIENYNWVNGSMWMKNGTVTINDLEQNLGLFGTIIVEGGELNIYQDEYQFLDLNCELYMTGGTMNLYGGIGDSYWSNANDTEIVIDDGVLDFKNVGIHMFASPTYNLGGEINGGLIRTVGSITCEENSIDMAGGLFEMYGPDAATVMADDSPLFSLRINKNLSKDGPGKLTPDPRDTAPPVKSPKANNVTLPASFFLYGDLIVASGTFDCQGYNMTIKRDLYIEPDGTLITGDATINIYGDWNNTHGSSGFLEGTGLVNFLGQAISYITTNETFYDLEINKTGSQYYYVWLEPFKTLTVSNDLIIGSCSFRLDSLCTLNVWHDLIISENANLMAASAIDSYINVGNNWFNYNTTGYPWAYGFVLGESTVTFNGTDDQFIEASYGLQDFYNLKINKADAWFMPTVNLNIYGDAEIVEGNWNQDVTGKIFSFYGDFTIQADGTFDDPVNVVHFKGPDDQSLINYGSNNAYLKYMYVVKDEAAEVPSVLTLMGDLDCYFLWIQEGEVFMNSQTITCDYRIQISEGGILNGNAHSEIAIADAGALLVAGGELSLFGDGVNNPKVTHTTGYYTFAVYGGGVIKADNVLFEYMDIYGVHIYNNGVVDDINSLDNCTFQNGEAGGALLNFGTSQQVTIDNAYFPANTWGGTYNVRKTNSTGDIVMSDASGAFSGEDFEYDPYDVIDWGSYDFFLEVKVFLEGPFAGTFMNFNLMPNMPLSQPFNTAPWNYDGTESVSVFPGKTVDWVLIELRDAPSAATALAGTVIARQAAFVKNNGYVLDLNGNQFLSFDHIVNQNLYVVVWHRNHLGVLSAYPLFKVGDTYSYDFSTALDQAQGDADAHKQIAPGVYGMVAGDADSDGAVGASDLDAWSAEAGKNGYFNSDMNFDAQVENKDKNELIILNSGWECQVPD